MLHYKILDQLRPHEPGTSFNNNTVKWPQSIFINYIKNISKQQKRRDVLRCSILGSL